MNWISFGLGAFCCYVVIAWVMVCCDGKGGVELFDGWLVNVLTAPVLVIAPIIRPIYKIYEQAKMRKKKSEKQQNKH